MADKKDTIGQFMGPSVHDPDPKKVDPLAQPRTGYALLGDRYSPFVGAADPGSLAGDPFLYERQLERNVQLARTSPGKLAAHALTQVGMFAQNVHGTVWNPALVAPPPDVPLSVVRPALDLPADGDTKDRQVNLLAISDAGLDGTAPGPDYRYNVTLGTAGAGAEPTLTRVDPKSNLARAFENVRNVLSNGLQLANVRSIVDPLYRNGLAFEDGRIPVRLRGDNDLGFRTFRGGRKGAQGDQTDDDSVYVPLSFTDLRPVGDVYRAVYFRPMITAFSENFSPEWNKTPYLGRVDPVATYQSTGRTINVSFQLVAFGPEDVKTIYQKLHWLQSMVYPEYDSNLVYRSGPVVRMRIGDVVNARGPEGGRGLPGIIDSLDFDYADALWELKKNYKLPRNVNVSVVFTVLHDVPVGRGLEGQFGGLGEVDSDGRLNVRTGVNLGSDGEQSPLVKQDSFRKFGVESDLSYDALSTVDVLKRGR